MTRAILTVVGHDKTGVIAKFSATLSANNANILDVNQNIMNGDIFAVALLGEIEREEITAKLDSLFSRIKKEFSAERSLNILSVSAGIADTPNPSQSVDDVIRRCGYAVAHLKRRNGFTIALDPTRPPSPLLLDLLRTKADSAYCFYDDLQK